MLELEVVEKRKVFQFQGSGRRRAEIEVKVGLERVHQLQLPYEADPHSLEASSHALEADPLELEADPLALEADPLGPQGPLLQLALSLLDHPQS